MEKNDLFVCVVEEEEEGECFFKKITDLNPLLSFSPPE